MKKNTEKHKSSNYLFAVDFNSREDQTALNAARQTVIALNKTAFDPKRIVLRGFDAMGHLLDNLTEAVGAHVYLYDRSY
jgi:hypothetical protein